MYLYDPQWTNELLDDFTKIGFLIEDYNWFVNLLEAINFHEYFAMAESEYFGRLISHYFFFIIKIYQSNCGLE